MVGRVGPHPGHTTLPTRQRADRQRRLTMNHATN
ncbi:hypothetical protein SFR_4882 [Streptomyces sp. FR-008]|nr:hypothetical protein SFR_4882 [Streptomyces sp. FR-008]